MDSHCFGFRASGSDLSHSSASSDLLMLFKSSNLGPGNSLNSPSSIQFNTEALSAYSDCQEYHSSSENLSEASPSYNSSLNHNGYLQQSRTSALFREGSISSSSGGQASLPNGNNGQNIQHALQTLEIALMAADDATTSELHLGGSTARSSSGQKQETQGSHSHQSESSHDSWFGGSTSQVHIQKQHSWMDDLILQGVPPNYNLKQLLIACAQALSEDRLDIFERLVEYARARVSISGDPIQRLGAYMLEGLIARRELSGTNIYRALKCNEPACKDLLSYMHILYEICPYMKFGYMAANGAIAEACKDEDQIHILDFQIAQGTQWMTLLQALAARPRGAPHVRITGIDDPVSKHARGDGLAAVGQRFAKVSEKFNIPIEFHAVPAFAPDLRIEMLEIRPGEALAVNFPLLLHHIPDESVDVSNPRDGLLRMVKLLSPKVVTLVEQESNTNTAPFLPRFKEALDFYSAMFESIDIILARDRKERISMEQHCLARDIVNIIACEGRERVERHELLGKWRSRFMMAGFQQIPLSPYINTVIRGLLLSYSDKYTLVEKHGAMLLGWQDRDLISTSAWH